jgi:hypothetical protein
MLWSAVTESLRNPVLGDAFGIIEDVVEVEVVVVVV